MFYLLQDTPINFPKLTYRYLCEPLDRPRLTLPYGMMYTLIFRESGIPSPEGEPSRALRWTDRMSEGTFHRMGFHKVEGTRVRQPSSSTPTTRRSPSPDPDSDYPTFPSTSAPSTSAGPSSSAPPTQPMEVRISPEQLRELRQEIVRDLRDDLLRELRGPATAPSTAPSFALVPSLSAVTEMTAHLREEIYNVRSRIQAQCSK